MSSSNKTSLGLNLWSGTDTPKREDFNEDNRIIDSELNKRVDKSSGWKLLTLLNGCTNVGATSAAYKIQGELIVFRGYVNVPLTPNITIANLPEEARPMQPVRKVVTGSSRIITIESGGILRTSGTSSAAENMSLDFLYGLK